jgi:hypothetical protein
MMRIFLITFAAGLCISHSPLSGQQSIDPNPASVRDHAHPEHGPHGGELLEVGKEEYHVELIIDEGKKQLIVYLMDGKVKDFVALDVSFLAVNLKISGKPVQLKLLPVPQETDPKGFASRFGIASPQLVDALHGGHADARLALKIGGKAYTVKLEHDHDHTGHNHAGHQHGPRIAK